MEVGCYLLNDSIYDGMTRTQLDTTGTISYFYLSSISGNSDVFFGSTVTTVPKVSKTQKHVKVVINKNSQYLYIDNMLYKTTALSISTPIQYVGFDVHGKSEINNILISKRLSSDLSIISGSYYTDFTIPTFDFSRDMIVINYKYTFSDVSDNSCLLYTYLLDNSFDNSMSENALYSLLETEIFPFFCIGDTSSIKPFFDSTLENPCNNGTTYSLQAIITKETQELYIDNTLIESATSDLTTQLKYIGFKFDTTDSTVYISDLTVTKYSSPSLSMSKDIIIDEFFNVFTDLSTDKFREFIEDITDYDNIFQDLTNYVPTILLDKSSCDYVMGLNLIYLPTFSVYLSKIIDGTTILSSYESNICTID